MRVTESVQQFCLILAGAECNFKVELSSFFTLFLQKKDVAEQLTPMLPDGPREESLQFVSELKVGAAPVTVAAAAALQEFNQNAAGNVVCQRRSSPGLCWAGLLVLVCRGCEHSVVGSSRLQGAARGHRLRERRVPLGAPGRELLGKGAHLAPGRGTNTALVSRAKGSFLVLCISSQDTRSL